ncbi:unnamed protein product [Cuscuta epithymum]|uniref:Cysteine-rich receptor-like protein kinase 2 n=1 Tax=Cuscuta epithymum TaxID=186058 RepID=A0AAV0EWL2_9ASTE|nr:unnamed protein product [Cuscuta epithymum]
MKLNLQRNPFPFLHLLNFIAVLLWSRWALGGGASDPQTNWVQLWCDQDGDNDGSVLREVLNGTIADLRGQIGNQSLHFAKAQGVKGNTPVYGLFQCREYLSIPDCLACFDVAAVKIRSCSTRAYGARVVYDGCFLRYESSEKYEVASESWNNIDCGNQSSPALVSSTVQQALTNLDKATPKMINPKMYAATKTPLPNSNNGSSNIYAMAQCVETLTTSGCQSCLDTALGLFRSCLTSSNARSYDTGCFMRYSTTAFFVDNQTTVITSFLKQGSNNKGAIIGGVVGVLALALVLLGLFFWIRTPKSHRRFLGGEITGISNLKGPVNYHYRDLKLATRNFNEENKIGEGGFGAVYKGTLRNGKEVAIKKLTIRQSKKVDELFESEVKLISNVHHRNLVRLLGCCSTGKQRILVYEYMRKTSLDRFLFGKGKGSLNWNQRHEIILGTARGLAYLHEEFHVRIIHRDVKTNNILLDDDLQPKIADFGLARLLPEDRSHLSTKCAGTLGYIAPEYAIHGQLSEKVDVYSFGVIVLEIISGQRSNELKVSGAYEGEFLLLKAWNLYKRDLHVELADESLDPSDYEAEEMKRIIEIGLLCTQASPEIRPTMSQVVLLIQNKCLSETMRPTMPILIQNH